MSIKQLSIATLASILIASATAADKAAENSAQLVSLTGVEATSSRGGAKANNAAQTAKKGSGTLEDRQGKRLSVVQQSQLKNKTELVKDGKRKKSLTNKKLRSETVTKSSRANHFSFYDAQSYLIDDIDGDGYYSEFEIVFDADTAYDWAEVYAVLYIRRGNGDWIEYYETDVFDIYGYDGSDDYSVTTVLNFDYPTGEYDILIDLYEVGYSGIVATWSSYEDADLYALPLEDREHESYGDRFWFYDITTDLLYDADNDGFYSEFAMSFDIDTDYGSADVYAEIFFLNEQGNWEREYTSDTIYLDSNSTLDTVHLEFEWNSGYPTGYYDFKIVVRDAYTSERLIETYGEFSALNAVPLESFDYDSTPSSGNSGSGSYGHGHGSSTSYESGGAWSIVYILLLSGVAVLRRKSLGVRV